MKKAIELQNEYIRNQKLAVERGKEIAIAKTAIRDYSIKGNHLLAKLASGPEREMRRALKSDLNKRMKFLGFLRWKHKARGFCKNSANITTGKEKTKQLYALRTSEFKLEKEIQRPHSAPSLLKGPNTINIRKCRSAKVFTAESNGRSSGNLSLSEYLHQNDAFFITNITSSKPKLETNRPRSAQEGSRSRQFFDSLKRNASRSNNIRQILPMDEVEYSDSLNVFDDSKSDPGELGEDNQAAPVHVIPKTRLASPSGSAFGAAGPLEKPSRLRLDSNSRDLFSLDSEVPVG